MKVRAIVPLSKESSESVDGSEVLVGIYVKQAWMSEVKLLYVVLNGMVTSVGLKPRDG